MSARWTDPEPATRPAADHVLDDAATWLLVMFLASFLVMLAVGLS